MTQMTNQETDTALILENELTRRVREVMQGIVWEVVNAEFKKHFFEHKEKMMMEIAISVGNMIRIAGEEGRKPLWETDMDKLGFGQIPIHHSIGKVDKDALHKQTPPL